MTFFAQVKTEYNRIVEFLTANEQLIHQRQLLKLAIHNAYTSKGAERDKYMHWARIYHVGVRVSKSKRSKVYRKNRNRERAFQEFMERKLLN